MKNWIIVALAATVLVLVADYVSASSLLRSYTQIRLGMSSTQATAILNERHIYCGVNFTQNSDSQVCIFSDPWRDYYLKFDSNHFLVQKRFGFRRARGLLARTLFGS